MSSVYSKKKSLTDGETGIRSRIYKKMDWFSSLAVCEGSEARRELEEP